MIKKILLNCKEALARRLGEKHKILFNIIKNVKR